MMSAVDEEDLVKTKALCSPNNDDNRVQIHGVTNWMSVVDSQVSGPGANKMNVSIIVDQDDQDSPYRIQSQG